MAEEFNEPMEDASGEEFDWDSPETLDDQYAEAREELAWEAEERGEEPAPAELEAEAGADEEPAQSAPDLSPEEWQKRLSGQYYAMVDERKKKAAAEAESERLRAELEALKAQQSQPQEPPDPEEDPEGYYKFFQAQQQEELLQKMDQRELEREVAQYQESHQQWQQEVVQWMAQDRERVKEHIDPGLDNAQAFLLQKRTQQLLHYYPGSSEEVRYGAALQELTQLTRHAVVNQQRSPWELVLTLAREYGWNAEAAKGPPKVGQRAKQIRRNQAAARPAGGGAGGVTGLEGLSELDGTDFLDELQRRGMTVDDWTAAQFSG